MRTIQITMDDKLLAALDRALKGGARRRSAFIRQSIASELKRLHRKRLEGMDRRGYEANPVAPGEFEVHPARLAWGDAWEGRRKKSGRK